MHRNREMLESQRGGEPGKSGGETPSVLVFGDSNTYGLVPNAKHGVWERHPADIRWGGRFARISQGRWRVIEDGLPGRTTNCDDPVYRGSPALHGRYLNGLVGLHIALRVHAPLGGLALSLGTNDLKAAFDREVQTIAEGVGELVEAAKTLPFYVQSAPFPIVILSPPPVLPALELSDSFDGAVEKSQNLADAFRNVAMRSNVGYIDLGEIAQSSPIDGVHWDRENHARVATAVWEFTRSHW